jgi:hypothetical protein
MGTCKTSLLKMVQFHGLLLVQVCHAPVFVIFFLCILYLFQCNAPSNIFPPLFQIFYTSLIQKLLNSVENRLISINGDISVVSTSKRIECVHYLLTNILFVCRK